MAAHDVELQPVVCNGVESDGATAAVDMHPEPQTSATDAPIRRDRNSADLAKRASKTGSRIIDVAYAVAKPFRRTSASASEIEVWTTTTDKRKVTCAKIVNTGVLTRPGPDVWTKLEGIQRLEIEDREGMLQVLPKQFCSELYNMEELSATWTNIRALPSRLFQLPLTSLDVPRNKIKSLEGLEQAVYLSVLDVSNNFLELLPDNVGHLSSLVTLNVAGNRITELPESIGSLRRLKTFNCSNNRLQSLPNSLCNASELADLDVSNNELTNLPVNIGELANLKDFRAQSNALRSLPNSFSQLQSLTSLLLRNNNFEVVPTQLASLASLHSLNVSDNQLKSMNTAIPSLRYLVLDQNDFAEIAVGILRCANLGLLSLQTNRIIQITGDFSQLTNLRSLFLSDNAINEVPAELCRLTQLLHLDLSSTNVKTIPLAVASITSLQTIKLEDCTELDHKLKDNYTTRGLTGVVEYLQQQPTTKTKGPKSPKGVGLRPQSREDAQKNTITKRVAISIIPDGNVSSGQPATSSAGSSSSIQEQQSSNSRPIVAKKPTKL